MKTNKLQFTDSTNSSHSFSVGIIAMQTSGVPEPALVRLYIYVCQANPKAWRRFSSHMGMWGKHLPPPCREKALICAEGRGAWWKADIPELLSDVERLPYQTLWWKTDHVHLGSGSHSRLVFDVKSFAPLSCARPASVFHQTYEELSELDSVSRVYIWVLQSVPVNWIHGMLCLLIILLLPVKQGI